MNCYVNLVSKVLDNEHLSKALNDLVDEQCLNLVHKDWEARLENNPTYQDFFTRSGELWRSSGTTPFYEYEDSKLPNFQIVLVAYCKFAKPYQDKNTKPALIVLNSEPLAKIARAMTSDLGENIQIYNDFKFSFVRCGMMGCSDCGTCAEVFSKAGYKIDQMFQPCISDTRVFDGKRVVNRFYSQIESMFGNGTFLAILRLNVNVRYSFMGSNKQKAHKISGNVSDMIGFVENKLALSKKIDVGPLVQFVAEEISSADAKQDENVEAFMTERVANEKIKKRKAPLSNAPETKKTKMVNEVDIDDIEEFISENVGNESSTEDCTDACEIENLLLI